MVDEIEIRARARVLVAEDCAVTRRLFERYLSDSYEVMLAGDGAKALAMAKEHDPDLILSDVEMPVVDGLKLARLLKSSAHLSHIPLILVTARSGEHAVVECLDAGADDYLRKPVEIREFRARVSAALRSSMLAKRLHSALDTLSAVQENLSLTLDTAADAIVGYDARGLVHTWNHAARALFFAEPSSAPTSCQVTDLVADGAVWEPSLGQPRRVSLPQKDGHLELEIRVAASADLAHRVAVIRDLTWRVQAEAELRSAAQRQLESARLAGQAEVATGVLHSVGNVLNSVNVSAGLVRKAIGERHERQLFQLSDLLQSMRSQLEASLGDRASNLIDYCALLAADFSECKRVTDDELTRLLQHVTHANSVVSSQQRYARRLETVAPVSVPSLIDTATRLAMGSQTNVPILVRRLDCQSFVSDEHRVLEILVNLLRNAADAVSGVPTPRIVIGVQASRSETDAAANVTIRVQDNGVGLEPDALTRIFEYGYTTKPQGHGFGLHYCANAARELGGRLDVSSGGLGQGACFELELPKVAGQQDLHSQEYDN